ncbi:hypothetical protein MLD38_004160 [Melastoma candidum]|uniref:Uncharacterized protein n=1 Tax=Melastoma candidum TaxID=119954 RepID=A0ACB9S9G5_9MYRT|nr:hypothetical protein MLD38_004160 [Melastoma candidum]
MSCSVMSKVMPLRSPPRLHFGNRSWNSCPDAFPPTSLNPAIRLLLQRRKFWNYDFNPFAVALEKVREEDRGRTRVRNHRRARSLSPFRAFKLNATSKTTSNPMPCRLWTKTLKQITN